MSNVDPEFGDGEEEEVGARLSRLENLVGNLVRAVGEQRTQNAPVSRGECESPASTGGRWAILQCVLSILCHTRGLDLGQLPPVAELRAIPLAHDVVRVSEPDGNQAPGVSARLVEDTRVHQSSSNVVGSSSITSLHQSPSYPFGGSSPHQSPSYPFGGSSLHQSPSYLVGGPSLHQSLPYLVGGSSLHQSPSWARRSTSHYPTWSGARRSTSHHPTWSGARRSTSHHHTWSGARRSTSHYPTWSGARRSTSHHPTWSGARRSTSHHPIWSGARRSTSAPQTRLGTRGLGVRSPTNHRRVVAARCTRRFHSQFLPRWHQQPEGVDNWGGSLIFMT